ncbi:MAG: hypothetical protein FWD47_08930 [Treponema sp.]|nr:hypothetical protein [Treponema sp.]
MRILIVCCLLILIPAFAFSQVGSRGSIPEDLFRPAKGESAFYPIDTVIGEMGRGRASVSAFSFANLMGNALLSGQMNNPVLMSINSSVRERYLSAIRIVNPLNIRIGGGRELPDGTVSFLIRFVGRDQAVTGEMYIRFISGNWTLDELHLEEARFRDNENRETHRSNYFPYERFY